MGEDLAPKPEDPHSFINDDEEHRFDTLMDTAGKTDDEAWRIVISERKSVHPAPQASPPDSRKAVAEEQRAIFADIHAGAVIHNANREAAIQQEKDKLVHDALQDPSSEDVEHSSPATS